MEVDASSATETADSKIKADVEVDTVASLTAQATTKMFSGEMLKNLPRARQITGLCERLRNLGTESTDELADQLQAFDAVVP